MIILLILSCFEHPSTKKFFKEYGGGILFLVVFVLLIYDFIFSPNMPHISDFISSLNSKQPDPARDIFISALGGALVIASLYLIAWGQDWTAKMSLSGKHRRLDRIQKKFEHVAALKQDEEKLVLELARTFRSVLLYFSLSIAGWMFATVFIIMSVISFQPNLSFSIAHLRSLAAQSFPSYAVMAEGLVIIFGSVMLYFAIRTCLDVLKLMANIKDFNFYKSKVEKRITELSMSIKSS